MSDDSNSKNRNRMSSATRRKWDKKHSKAQEDDVGIKTHS